MREVISKNKVKVKLSDERWAKEVLSIPMHPKLSEDEVEYVTSNIREFFKE